MFKSIILDDAAQTQAIIAFTVTASVFLLIMMRALQMPKKDTEHNASLPLQQDSENTHHS